MVSTFQVSFVPPVARMKIAGELDVRSRAPLAWRLDELEQSDCTEIYLDLGEVTHIDSGCLRLIDDARRLVERAGGRLELSSVPACFAISSRGAGFRKLAALAE